MSTYSAIIIIELMLAILALVYIPRIILKRYPGLSDEKRFNASIEIRKMVVTSSGALLVASSAFLAWEEYRLEEYKDFGHQIRSAMTLLSNQNTTSRGSGVYALARVIEDSPDDANQLLEMLALNVNDWASKQKNDITQSASLESTLALNTFGKLQQNHMSLCGKIRFANLNLRYLTMTKSSYKHCAFRAVDFTGSELRHSDFSNTTLTSVTFDGSDLSNAKFSNSKLQSTTFRGADLRGVDFIGASGLESRYFEDARVNTTTKFPKVMISELKKVVKGELL